jgi:hypothetical protein
MGPKINKNENANSTVNETIKAKRGRKSKKELMSALNMETLLKEKPTKKPSQIINLNVVEIVTNPNDNDNENEENTIYESVLDDNNINEVQNNQVDNVFEESKIQEGTKAQEEPKVAKKRGRKPKGGKIIQQTVSNETHKEEKPNVILHLKCSMKDLLTTTQTNTFMESYTFLAGKNEMNYEIIGSDNINTVKNFNDKNLNDKNVNDKNLNDKHSTVISTLDSCYDCDDYDDDSVCKDSSKEIWKKLKQLEHNLHINNVNNKRSCCFWDTCEFDNPPIYIPKHFINGTYHVYGCFCSPECGVAYLMNENIDSSTKFERYHLFNHIYTKIYDYKKNIKPSPNPYYMLEKYYGNLSIQEYRSLLRNERLFLIVDKPLTRILPELHEDNDDFILNNKIIPSNNYQVKSRLHRKKQNKSSILNEKFGTTNNNVLLE